MAQHVLQLPQEGQSPAYWYEKVRHESGFEPDPAQEEAIRLLEQLYQELLAFKLRRARPFGKVEIFGLNVRTQPVLPRGLYLWGGVGRGKTLLMDIFFAGLPYRRKRREHFHAFMQWVHAELGRLKGEPDPLAAVANHIAVDVRVLCFDEFHISDIADAMILGRLFEHLFQRGVVLLLTSNYAPDDLYPNGLQRHSFLPTIALIKAHIDVLNLDGGRDHRQRLLTLAPLYLMPLDEAQTVRLAATWAELAQGSQLDPILNINGYRLQAQQRAPGMIWFDFAVLCGDQRSQVDYLYLARQCHTLFVSNIPQLGPAQAAEARRLTWLIDVLYDYRVKLIATAAVAPEALYPEGEMAQEFLRTASRLIEMQTMEYLTLAHDAVRWEETTTLVET